MLIVKPYVRLAMFEVNLQFGVVVVIELRQQGSSLSLAIAGYSVMKPSGSRQDCS